MLFKKLYILLIKLFSKLFWSMNTANDKYFASNKASHKFIKLFKGDVPEHRI